MGRIVSYVTMLVGRVPLCVALWISTGSVVIRICVHRLLSMTCRKIALAMRILLAGSRVLRCGIWVSSGLCLNRLKMVRQVLLGLGKVVA